MSYQLQRSRQAQRNKYVDLRINGRLFPSWILANFKQYKLPEIIRGDADPCNDEEKDKQNRQMSYNLRLYQQWISQYLDYKSQYRDILVYHGLGSGKTASAINVYNVLYNYTPGWNVFILIKASLKGGWLKDIKRWLSQDEFKHRYDNIIFVHYDSPIADKKFMDAIKTVDSSKKSLYIIDEVHNFIRNVYSNISSEGGKRAQTIYDYIIQDKLDSPDTRVVLLSGTPAINKPFELALLFNLLRPGIFPKSENEFNHLFITTTTHSTMNKNNKNLFQRRIMGLVSFYIGATPDLYAKKQLHYVDVPMSEYQEDVYTHYEELEDKIALKAKMAGRSGSTTYKSYTRQACNFVFPVISQRVTGELRPRPSNFKMTEREALKLEEGKELKSEKGSDKVVDITEYHSKLKLYITSFDEYLNEKYISDKKANHTIMKDLELFLTKYEKDFMKFHNGEQKKSQLYTAMWTSSAKMINAVFNIMASPGPVLVYSNYVLMEGLEIFKIYLKYFGFYSYMDKKELRKDQVGYVEFHGGIKDVAERYKAMEVYNLPENKYGSLIKIILISPAGSEGLNLKNTRQVHILEPYWNEVRVTQMIGRAIRQCSHKDLALEDRVVDVYRYKSIRTKGERWTTDQIIEDLARSKDSLMQSFLDAIKEVAIDCVLFRNHNMMAHEYKCFQFEERSLFNNFVGPAYKKNIYDDMRIDNGSNATNSVTMKIKVLKIKAVRALSEPDDTGSVEYSKSDSYWYNSKSGVVYDLELHYPIGKIIYDQDNLPQKMDKDTYIIGQVIPIPMIV